MSHFIRSSHLKAGIKARGAELFSLTSLHNGVELIWQADPAHWARHAPILFPIVGKLKDNTFMYEGREYTLPQHGFARDQVFHLLDISENSATFELRADDQLKENYPFDFSLCITYQLTGYTLNVTCEVGNRGTGEQLYSIGAHPAFRVPVHSNAKRSDYELCFSEIEALPVYVLHQGLLTGEKADSGIQAGKLPISDHLFDHDALVFKELKSRRVSIALKNKSPFLDFEFNSPYFGIWSKSAESEFICLEPWWGIADNALHNHELSSKEGIRYLQPMHWESFGYSVTIHPQ